MSNISQSYDAFVTRLSTVLPTHARLTDAYEPRNNTEVVLTKAWGLAIGPAQNTFRQVQCQLSVRRTMQVTLTRKYYARELDIASKASTDKQLLEDQFLVIKDLEKDPTINASSYVVTFKYVSDSGISSVFKDKENFIKIDTVFELEYFETL